MIRSSVSILAFLAGCITITKQAESSPQATQFFGSTQYEFTATSCTRCVQEEMMQIILPNEKVGLLVDDSSEFDDYSAALTGFGVTSSELANLVEYDVDHTDIWLRDYLVTVDYRVTGTSKQISNAEHSYGYSGPTPFPLAGKAIVDFDFDGWGFEPFIDAELGVLGYYDTDDAIASGLASALHVPTITSPLIAEGGAMTSNGAGTIMYSYKALHERQPSWTQQQIETELERVTGARKLLTPPYMHLADGQPVVDPPITEADGTVVQVFGVNHIDEVAAFADAHTIVAEYLDQSYVHTGNAAEQTLHDQLDANYNYWVAATDQDGHPFTVIKLPDPGLIPVHVTADDAVWQYLGLVGPPVGYDPAGGDEFQAGTYVNYVVSNSVVIVSKFDDGTDPSLAARDAAAVSALEGAYPGRQVVQIDARDVEVNGGGMHCITQGL
jgi:agmatine deiminase